MRGHIDRPGRVLVSHERLGRSTTDLVMFITIMVHMFCCCFFMEKIEFSSSGDSCLIGYD